MTAMGKSRFVAPAGPGTRSTRMTDREFREHIKRENQRIAALASEVKSIQGQPTIPEGTREMNKAAWKAYWQSRYEHQQEQFRKQCMEDAIREKEIRDLYENPPEIIRQCYTWTDGYYRCTLYHQHDGEHDYGARA